MIEVNGNLILTPIYQILLDLQAELKYSGSHLLHTIKPPHSYNSDIIVSCPVHNHGLEQHPSASITQIEKHKGNKVVPAGFMYCFSCHTKATIDVIISYCFGKNDNGEFGRQWLLDHYANFEVEQRDKYFNKLQEHEKQEITYVSEEELEHYRYIHPYMYKRGLTDELIERYDIGYQKDFRLNEKSKPFECITFPVRDINGNTLFVARRAIKHKLYHYPNQIDKPLYGIYEVGKYHNGTNVLYICESMLNAITLEKWGFPAIALLGTGSKEQNKLLKSMWYRKYILCLDGDKAGELGTYKLIKALENTHMLLIHKIKEKGIDINDLATLEKEEYMRRIVVMTKEEFMYDYSENQSRD
ncbi:MAG: toprim domain-containing protein [Bacilli bacterium]|nr:toprim domain-containing protein [Bacilli bacterium]